MRIDASKINAVCLRTLDHPHGHRLETYIQMGGYSVWNNVLNGKEDHQSILKTIQSSGLRGRGGAGFPTGLKWSFVSYQHPGQKYLLCNADEGEPGTCKDRDILTYNPHQVIEGMAIGAYLMGASVAYIYMRGEFSKPMRIFKDALREAYQSGLLGRSIQNTCIDLDIYIHVGAGAYICGEETALMESLEGKRAMPRFKPPFPANYGLYGKPTTINNVETLASIPEILRRGASWFASAGTEKSGGFKIFSVTGHVEKPGNYEIPMGTPFKDLLELAGGVWKGRSLKAVIPGGSSMPVLPASIMMDVCMDYESMMQAGSMLGSGAVIIMDDTTSMPHVCRRIAKFYQEESCGQCTPCREGTGWMFRIVDRLCQGKGCMADIDELVRIASNIEGRTICAFGEASAWPMKGFIRHFRHEFEALVRSP